MIVTTKVKSGILVSICNFNDYQDPNFYEGNNEKTTNGNTNGQRSVADMSHPINEEGKKKEKKEKKEKLYITPALGEFENVLFTVEELEKLKERFPYDWVDRIERLSAYMQSTGKRYKSHYATVLNWARKDEKDERNRPNGRPENVSKQADGTGDEDPPWIIQG